MDHLDHLDASGFTTAILHNDRYGGPEHRSLHQPIHTSVAYGYAKASDLAAVFQGTKKGFAYARQANPTVAALERMVTRMEGGAGSLCFGTGMAAIGALFLALLRAGDHVVSSAYLFGNTASLLNTLAGIGIGVTFVDATDARKVREAVTPRTRMVLAETVANPVTQVADLEGMGELCRELGLIYIVDNTMTSPYLFRPRDVGATFALNALTKYIGGHGDALAGAITDTGLYDWTTFPNILDLYRQGEPSQWALLQLRKKGLRDFGAALAPEAAHAIAVGAETLALRMERCCANAQALAEFLAGHPKVRQVNYPGLAAHPQHERARKLFKRPGALLSFALDPAEDLFAFLDRLRIVISSSNLGDSRTLAIPVAHTIYYELGREKRAAMGIDESLIRLSVGIEDPEDLLGDFRQALG